MENDEYKRINAQIVEILHNLLETGNWEASLFLRTAHKRLQAFYDQALALEKQFEKEVSESHDQVHKMKMQQGYVKVYVSIYQSDPYNLIKWENTLKSIKEYSINRPIYRSEEYIEEMIRSKHGSPNEAYVVIYIPGTDIIPAYAGKLIADRWGHELLTLRDNSLRPENIAEFVHQGRRYIFSEGKLLLKSESS